LSRSHSVCRSVDARSQAASALSSSGDSASSRFCAASLSAGGEASDEPSRLR
jgi:hypothetical protein